MSFSYGSWLQSNWISLVPFSIIAIIGIILSISHLNRKGKYAVFSLIAYSASLISQWFLNYLQINAIYNSNSQATRTIFILLLVVVNLTTSIFLMVAIFSHRQPAPQSQPFQAYMYNQPVQPQQPINYAGQAGYQYPQNPPQQRPQPPQTPPLSGS